VPVPSPTIAMPFSTRSGSAKALLASFLILSEPRSLGYILTPLTVSFHIPATVLPVL
jgi:hypothetical protein